MTGAALSDLLRRLAARAAAWPPLPRDLAAASLALWSVCLGELLIPLLPVPAEALLALPGVMLAWWALGGASAAFALLATLLAVDLLAGDRDSALAGAGASEVLCLLALGGALVASGIAARAWARSRERRAALLLDACARDALGRIGEADRRLARAEAEAAGARSRLAAAEAALGAAQRAAADAAVARGLRSGRDTAFEAAWRSEGGI
jgi:hypothetical protein